MTDNSFVEYFLKFLMKHFFCSILVLALASLACQSVQMPLVPTATPGITEIFNPPTPAPTPLPNGQTRADPIAFGEVMRGFGWQTQVERLVRGDQAWNALLAANQFNQPAPEGWEYLLVQIRVKNTDDLATPRSIAGSDFQLTGDNLQAYFRAPLVTPSPTLEAELKSGEETTGWSIYLIKQGEANLLLILDPLNNSESFRYYLALEEGARIAINSGLAQITPTHVGEALAEPARINETTTAENWQLTLLKVVRGDKAWQMLYETNSYNDPAPPGMEYILVQMSATNIAPEADEPSRLFNIEFKAVARDGTEYDTAAVVKPDPGIDHLALFPSGELTGWVAILAPQNGAVVLRYEPLGAFNDNTNVRYFSLEP
jgi:hypothetical protein